jgi:hypothetical protein
MQCSGSRPGGTAPPASCNFRGDHTCINFEFLLLTPCNQQASKDHNSNYLPGYPAFPDNLLDFTLRKQKESHPFSFVLLCLAKKKDFLSKKTMEVILYCIKFPNDHDLSLPFVLLVYV